MLFSYPGVDGRLRYFPRFVRSSTCAFPPCQPFLCVKTSRSFEYRVILFKRCPITEGQVEAVAPEAVVTAVDTTAGVVAGMVAGMAVDMAGVATAMGDRNTTS